VVDHTDQLWTSIDVARYANVGADTVRWWCRTKKIVPAFTTSTGQRFFRPSDVEKLVEIRRQKAHPNARWFPKASDFKKSKNALPVILKDTMPFVQRAMEKEHDAELRLGLVLALRDMKEATKVIDSLAARLAEIEATKD
jgi:hypothetical protein